MNLGFSSYGDAVIAVGEGRAMQELPVPHAQPESWEDVLHRLALENHLLIFPGQSAFTQLDCGGGARRGGVRRR